MQKFRHRNLSQNLIYGFNKRICQRYQLLDFLFCRIYKIIIVTTVSTFEKNHEIITDLTANPTRPDIMQSQHRPDTGMSSRIYAIIYQQSHSGIIYSIIKTVDGS